MSMRVELVLEGETRWKAIAGSGNSVTMDGPADDGGTEAGFRPMELLLVGLGGCMGYDMTMILRRMRQEVTGYRLSLAGERAEDLPSVYTSVKLHHVITGNNLNPDKVERALALATERYCSAWAMFSKTAKLTNSYQIEHGC